MDVPDRGRRPPGLRPDLDLALRVHAVRPGASSAGYRPRIVLDPGGSLPAPSPEIRDGSVRTVRGRDRDRRRVGGAQYARAGDPAVRDRGDRDRAVRRVRRARVVRSGPMKFRCFATLGAWLLASCTAYFNPSVDL